MRAVFPQLLLPSWTRRGTGLFINGSPVGASARRLLAYLRVMPVYWECGRTLEGQKVHKGNELRQNQTVDLVAETVSS